MNGLRTADYGLRPSIIAFAVAACAGGPVSTAPEPGGTYTRRQVVAFLDSAVSSSQFRASHWGILLVDPERGLTGTVGGGCGEAEVIETARDVIASGEPRLLRIDLTEDLFSWSPAVCGGVFDVFLEPI